MKRRLCITTYVSGPDYQDFIPIFIYSIHKAYPDYNVIIFVGEAVSRNVSRSLDLLRPAASFRIIENHLPYVPKSMSLRVSSMSKRWLLYDEEFLRYDYVYIGDIDIFIVKEEPALVEQHLIHCQTIGLDYSNIIRRSHYNRMSGLHFVKTEPYFTRMLPVIRKYTELLNNDELVYQNSCEYMLYDMISESGLGLCPRATGKDLKDPKQPSFRPNHGVHLAIFRNILVNKSDYNAENFAKKIEIMKNTINDPLFFQLERNFESRMVKRIIKRVKRLSLI